MLVRRDNFAEQFDVSRETIERLNEYQALLEKWNPKINLVSRTTLDQVWHRHFADSAQLIRHTPKNAARWLDFGSGAGFPGLLCAAIAHELQPELAFTLVESDHRKCAFLLSAAEKMGLKVQIRPERIEDMHPHNADIISARAVAPLDQLLSLSAKHTHKATVLLFPKGINYESELTAARHHWHIDMTVIQSLIDSNSVILRIEEFERADP